MYYKLGQACITNWGSFVLLKIGAEPFLQIGANVVTNWGNYYKLGQLLLQNRAAITNWSKVYAFSCELLIFLTSIYFYLNCV